jgi:hypothetical protein
MTRLLIVTAIIELGAGFALLCCPSPAVALLLGSPLDAPATPAAKPIRWYRTIWRNQASSRGFFRGGASIHG